MALPVRLVGILMIGTRRLFVVPLLLMRTPCSLPPSIRGRPTLQLSTSALVPGRLCIKFVSALLGPLP